MNVHRAALKRLVNAVHGRNICLADYNEAVKPKTGFGLPRTVPHSSILIQNMRNTEQELEQALSNAIAALKEKS